MKEAAEKRAAGKSVTAITGFLKRALRERKMLYLELVAQPETREEFLAAISHELAAGSYWRRAITV